MKRIAWIDYAKGLCIVLVVMLYATGLVERSAGSEGWLNHVVAFAKPFRMPDFFLISGLLLPLAIQRDWRTYLDRKVLHFAYFYALWLTILVAFEARWIAAESGWSGVGALYLKSFVHPHSMLWFIYLLPLFFAVTKLVQRAPPLLVWLLAAALQIAELATGIKVLDKFAMYYVYFYTGYALAPQVFRFADAVRSRPLLALAGLCLWGLLDAYLVLSGLAELPGLVLALALLGAAAVVALSALLAGTRLAAPLAYCGRNSIVIYLAFLIPMTVTHKLLRVTGWIEDLGWMALFATAGGIAGALLMRWVVEGTRLRFLFERPGGFSLSRHAITPARESYAVRR
ncbi:MAG: acyltransferase family protein [Woeseiaceae bacterium]